MATTNFLDMPREVRDMIYMYYTSIDGGYVYNPDTGKLRPATPCKQHLALQGTCKLLAEEMAGLAITHNVVSFSTVENMRHRAFVFDFFFDMFHHYEKHCLENHAKKEGIITDSTWEYMAQRFPAFIPLIDAVKPYIPNIPDTPVVSRVARMYAEALRGWSGVASSLNFAFIHVLVQQVNAGGDSGTVDLALHERNWMIPSDEELARMSKIIKLGYRNDLNTDEFDGEGWATLKEFNGPRETDNRKFYFSAAATAIQFLQSNPTLRLHMRKIILYEDNRSVARPETHGRGLIPFCAENAQLRIERRLNIWTHVYFAPMEYKFERRPTPSTRWILDALMLPPAISLVLDGDLASPEVSAHNFQQVFVNSAVRQKVLEEIYRRQLIPRPSFLDWISGETFDYTSANDVDYCGYQCEDWPQIIQDILDGTSPISCNFAVENKFDRDVEELVTMGENLHWSQEDWNNRAEEDKWDLKQPDKAPPNWDTHMELYEKSQRGFY